MNHEWLALGREAEAVQRRTFLPSERYDMLWSPLLGVGLSCLAGVGACIICGHESGIVESQQGDDELLEEYYTQFKDRADDKKYDLIPKFYSKV